MTGPKANTEYRVFGEQDGEDAGGFVSSGGPSSDDAGLVQAIDHAEALRERWGVDYRVERITTYDTEREVVWTTKKEPGE